MCFRVCERVSELMRVCVSGCKFIIRSLTFPTQASLAWRRLFPQVTHFKWDPFQHEIADQ